VGGPPLGAGHARSGEPGGADGRGLGRKLRALSEVRHGGARQKAYLLGAGALAIVLVVGGVLGWYFWPGSKALDFQTLSVVRHVSAPVAVSSSFADAEVIGDRIYFAGSEADSGRVGVVAIDENAAKPAWSSLAAGTAERWESMTALPDGVALLSASDVAGDRQLVVLSASDGHQRWRRVIDNNDDVYFVGDMAVLADNVGHQLLGLRLDNGTSPWHLAYPKTDFGNSTSVFVATTRRDLDGPATVGGRPLSPDADDDTRIVLVSADRSARVIDAENGVVRTSAQGVAGTDDEVVAHDGRLIVRQSEGTQRIASYQLDKLGEPKVLYTAQAPDNHLTKLTPCGDRVCFVEDAGYRPESVTVTAVDLDKGDRVWHHVLPGVNSLVPVGPDLLAATSSQTTLFDKAGTKVWSNRGDAVRLNAGNLLQFAKPLSAVAADDPSVAGQHLGDQPQPLGPLNDVRTDTCSWNTSVIACVADNDFVLLRFAK
jgi:molecular chaperone HscA